MIVGILMKMEVENTGTLNSIKPKYKLRFENDCIELNGLIGSSIRIKFLEKIFCIKCGRKTNKSFGQGYCYPCFLSAPEAEDCVLRPELCRAHEGIARDLAFAQEHCLIDHYVYLSWTGGLKVGVTRYHQIPTRWIDQGATQATIICRTPNRFRAGQIEVELKKLYADKTNWQAMLKDDKQPAIDLNSEKQKSLKFIMNKGFDYKQEIDALYNINYPVNNYPIKVKSHQFEKALTFTGVLKGIKGQYLILEDDTVLNIRNHSGYMVELESDFQS